MLAQGAPGRGSTGLLQQAYWHGGVVRHQAGAAEYRVEQGTAKLGDGLEAPCGVRLV